MATEYLPKLVEQDVQDFLLDALAPAYEASMSTAFPRYRPVAGLPYWESLRRVNGTIEPYIDVRWGNAVQAGGRSFGGARKDSYRMTVDFFCVAADWISAKDLRDWIQDYLVGHSPIGSGELNTIPGFALGYPILNAQNVVEAFSATTSLRTTLSGLDIEVP